MPKKTASLTTATKTMDKATLEQDRDEWKEIAERFRKERNELAERLRAIAASSIKRRFWHEFMIPAELDADDLAKCDPQEMVVFAFLVGSGIRWEQARMTENLEILKECEA